MAAAPPAAARRSSPAAPQSERPKQLREKSRRHRGPPARGCTADIEVVDGTAFVAGSPAQGVSFAEIAHVAYRQTDRLAGGAEPDLEASYRYQPPNMFTFSNACHICVCEVDIETGLVDLQRYIVSEDCGPMINPTVVEGQIAGGVVQGIGGVLYEHMAYDDDGNPLASTFLDYLLPGAAEMPIIEIGHIETPADTEGGFKGMAEGGTIGAPAAVANAVPTPSRRWECGRPLPAGPVADHRPHRGSRSRLTWSSSYRPVPST